MTLGRKIITPLIMSAFIIPLLLYADARGVQEGDIIFQTSLSSQSRAIQLATKSKYSHMGLILKEQGRFYVFEAVKNVKKTPLEEWIKRGEGGKYVIKRLKNADTFLDAKTLSKIRGEAEKFSGKEYDLTFEWSDEKMYCSELVRKIYKQSVDLEVGKLQKLGDFDLTHDAVKAKLKERFGSKLPLNETVISPAAMFESDLLEEVKRSDCEQSYRN